MLLLVSGKLGFVVQFATPVMSNVDEHGGGTYSWGRYYTRWTYGETLEEAASKALAWVEEIRAHERQKQRTEAVEAKRQAKRQRTSLSDLLGFEACMFVEIDLQGITGEGITLPRFTVEIPQDMSYWG